MDAGSRGPLAVDRLLAAYLAAAGALALLSLRLEGVVVAGVHAAAAAVVLRLGRRALPTARWALFLRVAYPVALTPLLYAELAHLNQLLTSGYLDTIVQGWERALFGVQLSVEAGRRLGGFWLSEFLHVGYFAYYLIVPAALVGAFRTRGASALHRVVFQTALAFFASYLVFVILPVAGPRYLFEPIAGERADGRIFGLVHAVLEGGSSKGTAFPSSHIAASWAAVLACWRVDRRWFWLLAAPALALAIGTVYGRFHYGVDALAGILLAGAAHAVSPVSMRGLGRVATEPEVAARPSGAGNP